VHHEKVNQTHLTCNYINNIKTIEIILMLNKHNVIKTNMLILNY